MGQGIFVALLVMCAAISVGCDRDAEDAAPEVPTIIFRDRTGRVLTTEELGAVTGEFQYEVRGSGSIPAEAESLHQQGRAAGRRGDYDKALELLAESSTLAPEWAYPVYDTAFTHLLRKDFDAAREHYRKTVELEPRGFFTAITALHTLNREQNGNLPKGTYLEYLSLEWNGDPAQKKERVRRLVEELPQFAPAWKELAVLLDDDVERMAAIEKGLAADPDAETRGMLEINRSLLLDRQEKHDEAIGILRELAGDPESTYATEHLANAALVRLGVK